MGTLTGGPAAKVTPAHLERLAVVYVRQSTLAQVREHGESTTRQYALGALAADLGWPPQNVTIVDADLGLSGDIASQRSGFREVVARVCLGEIGAIFGLEVSRLGRCSADLQRLLELARFTDTLLIDADGVYDLSDINDRLLLGLKSQMSEALCRRRHNASYADLVVMPMSDAPSAIRAGQRDPRFREVGIIRVIHSGTSCFRRRSAGDRPCLGRAASNP
jgi:Resolvase, N terminal domain